MASENGQELLPFSGSGFTSDARRKALRHNILPLSFEEAQDTEWLSDLKAYPQMSITFVIPQLASVDIKLVDKSLTASHFPTFKVAESELFRFNGDPMGTVLTLYNQLEEAEAIDASVLTRGVTRADGLLEVGLRLEDGAYFNTPDGKRIPVEGIVFLVNPNEEHADVNIPAAKYGPADIATGRAGTKFWRVQFAAVKGADGKPHLSLSVQAAKGQLPVGVVKVYGVRA